MTRKRSIVLVYLLIFSLFLPALSVSAEADYHALFDKRHYVDGIYADMYCGEMCGIFMDDPEAFVKALAQEAYSETICFFGTMLPMRVSLDYDADYRAILDGLLQKDSWSEAEKQTLTMLEYCLPISEAENYSSGLEQEYHEAIYDACLENPHLLFLTIASCNTSYETSCALANALNWELSAAELSDLQTQLAALEVRLMDESSNTPISDRMLTQLRIFQTQLEGGAEETTAPSITTDPPTTESTEPVTTPVTEEPSAEKDSRPVIAIIAILAFGAGAAVVLIFKRK